MQDETDFETQFDNQYNWVMLPTNWHIPQVIICSSLGNQVVNIHIAGLSNTMYPILCLNENLQKRSTEKKKYLSFIKGQWVEENVDNA